MVDTATVAQVYGLGFAVTVTAYLMGLCVGIAVSVVRKL